MPRRATAPKPASQAAAIVAAAQTLADRQRTTDELLRTDDASGHALAERPDAPTENFEPQITGEPRDEAVPDGPTTNAGERGVDTDAEPRAALPVAAQAVAAESIDVEQNVTGPEAAESGVAEPDVAEQVSAEPVLTRPGPAVTAQPEGTPERAREPDGQVTDAAASELATADETVLLVEGLSKSFAGTVAVENVDLAVRAGSIFGIVGPNGAGKTTTLSMVTGLLRPDSGRVLVHGADVWKDPENAKRNMGVLPDRLRLFDRLTGGQLLFYSGSLRGLNRATVKSRSRDLAVAFGLEDALSRLVTDYSAGMTKKIALAAAMIHSPRVLILDEPFEAVDPVSAANVIEILQKYAAAGGTVVMSSHSMDLIQRICDSVTIIVRGEVLASGTMEQVRNGSTLEDRFVELAGGRKAAEGMEWLHSFSG